MESADPFAPPSAPLDRPTRSRWGALWWFPISITATMTAGAGLTTILAAVMLFQRSRELAADPGMAGPPVGEMMSLMLGAGAATLFLGSSTYAWYRRRWVLGLVLIALCYGGGLLVFALAGRL